MRHDCRVTHADWTTSAQRHVAPQTHVLVWRSGVPVYPVDGQVVRGCSKDFGCEHIGFAGFDKAGDVEFVNSVGAGELMPVEPEVGSIVNAVEMEPDGFPLVFVWQLDLGAVPPGNRVGTVLRHGEAVKGIQPDGVGHAGQLTQVHAETWIGELAARHLYRQHSRGNSRLIPAFRVETRQRDGRAFGANFGRGLNPPSSL